MRWNGELTADVLCHFHTKYFNHDWWLPKLLLWVRILSLIYSAIVCVSLKKIEYVSYQYRSHSKAESRVLQIANLSHSILLVVSFPRAANFSSGMRLNIILYVFGSKWNIDKTPHETHQHIWRVSWNSIRNSTRMMERCVTLKTNCFCSPFNVRTIFNCRS